MYLDRFTARRRVTRQCKIFAISAGNGDCFFFFFSWFFYFSQRARDGTLFVFVFSILQKEAVRHSSKVCLMKLNKDRVYNNNIKSIDLAAPREMS